MTTLAFLGTQKWKISQRYDEPSNQTVLFKCYANQDVLARKWIQHEFELFTKIDCAWLLKPLELGYISSEYGIVYEHFNGISLKEWLRTKPQMTDFYKVAIDCTNALIALQMENILFQTFNPYHVLINPVSLQIKLISSSEAKHWHGQMMVGSPQIESLYYPYMAPEQTGLLYTQMDFMTDLYSLGVILYEMLMTKPPFEDAVDTNLLYKIVTKYQTSIADCDGSYPALLVELIDKLLAKKPENRYCSAAGLKEDLVKLQFQYLRNESELFELAAHDLPLHQQLVSKHYSNQQALHDLQHYFSQVMHGHNKLVYISGVAGVGKTTLVQQFQNDIIHQKVLCVTMKFTQLQTISKIEVILAPIKQLLAQVLRESIDSIQQWKRQLKKKGVLYSLKLIDYLPELSAFKQPDDNVINDRDLNAIQMQTFIYTMVQKIWSVGAALKRPLLLFIDDIHWAGQDVMDTLQAMYYTPLAQYTMTIYTYRQEELPASILTSLQQYPAEQLVLKPLTAENVLQWLEDTFQQHSEDLRKLAHYLYNLTKGNPLYVMELFKLFQAQNVMQCNPETRRWELNDKRLKSLDLQDEFLQLIVKRFEELDHHPRELLVLASCIGKQQPIDQLTNLLPFPWHQLQFYIEQLMGIGFIVADLNGQTQTMDPLIKYTSFQFTHDKIQQAIYETLTQAQKQRLHYAIGKSLLKEPQSETWITIVHHFNLCEELLKEEEKQLLADWNIKLAKHLKMTGLYKMSVHHLQLAQEQLGEVFLQTYKNQAYSFYALLGECQYLDCQYKASEISLNKALAYATKKQEILAIYSLRSMLDVEMNNPEKGIEYGFKGLEIANLAVSHQPSNFAVVKELLTVKYYLKKYTKEQLLDLPANKNLEMEESLRMIINLSSSVYRSNSEATGILLLRGAVLTLKYGKMSETALAFVNYALFLNVGVKDYAASEKMAQIALTMAKQENSIYLKARTYFVYGMFIGHWSHAYEMSIDYLAKAQQYAKSMGISHIHTVSTCYVIILYFVKGTPIQTIQQEITLQKQTYLLEDAKVEWAVLNEFEYWFDVLAGKKSYQSPLLYGEESAFFEKMMHGMIRVKFSYLINQPLLAKKMIEAFDTFIGQSFPMLFTQHYYFYKALWQVEWLQEQGCTAAQKSAYEKDIRKTLKLFKKWVAIAPGPYKHMYILLKAEWAHVQNQVEQAARYYDHAIQLAMIGDFKYEAAVANRQAARFYWKQNQIDFSEYYLTQARFILEKLGAVEVVKEWRANDPLLGNKIATLATHDLHLTTDVKAFFQLTGDVMTSRHVEELIENVLTTWTKFVGGNSGYFVTSEPLLVKAWIQNDVTYVYEEPKPLTILEQYQQELVYYTEQCRKITIVDDAFRQSFSHRAVLPAYSIVCLPILYKEQLKGIVLLENTLLNGVFHENQSMFFESILNLIGTSLENTMLYEKLEELVKDRTVELARANEELRHVNEQLYMQEAERKQLFHNISHELRSPITSSLGYIESILDGMVEDKEQVDSYLRRSKERLTILNRLIQDIFDLTNAESGRMEFEFYQVDVMEFVEYFRNRFEPDVLAANLRYEFHTKSLRNGYVYVDLERMDQVVWNLISNAIKYTNQGEVQMLFDIVDDQLQCQVCDTGRGISEADKAFVFDSYYKVNNVPQISSTGIGLSICKQIVLQHKGQILVDSKKDEGTIFTVRLPIFQS